MRAPTLAVAHFFEPILDAEIRLDEGLLEAFDVEAAEEPAQLPGPARRGSCHGRSIGTRSRTPL